MQISQEFKARGEWCWGGGGALVPFLYLTLTLIFTQHSKCTGSVYQGTVQAKYTETQELHEDESLIFIPLIINYICYRLGKRCISVVSLGFTQPCYRNTFTFMKYFTSHVPHVSEYLRKKKILRFFFFFLLYFNGLVIATNEITWAYKCCQLIDNKLSQTNSRK